MKTFFETKVKFLKTFEDGKIKTVSEQYLTDAVTCADAEVKTLAEVIPIYPDAEVHSSKVSQYIEYIPADVPFTDEYKFFGVKVSFITIDEEKGKEKKTSQKFLVQANTNKQANDITVEFMKGTLANYKINNVVETKIVDVLLAETK